MNDREEIFGADYFLNGVESGLSNYSAYRWLGRPTEEMAQSLYRHLNLCAGDSLLEFGCARGYVVRALRSLGVPAYGIDISRWAIANCDPSVMEYVSNNLPIKPLSFDWIFGKDVAEHIEISTLPDVIEAITDGCKKGAFFIVPLTDSGGIYLRQEDRQDVTHQIKWELQDWLKFLTDCAPDFTVEGSYHIPGLKPASLQVPYSCGFFTMKRIQ